MAKRICPPSPCPTGSPTRFARLSCDACAPTYPDAQNWKVRKEGYEDAKAQFETTPDESHPVFVPFIQDPGLWKGAVADSNVAAQIEGLAAYCAFLKFGGPHACTRCVEETDLVAMV